MLIRLSDEDRKRLGIDDEWIGADLYPITVNQAIVLQAEAGYRGGPDEMREAWNAQIETAPDGEQEVTVDFRVWKARVWLAVNRYGVKVPYADFDFDMSAIQYDAQVPADDAEGKEPDSTPERTTET